jgi:cytochrome c nitrite reductase small subunit
MEPASNRRFALGTRAAFIAVITIGIALGLGAYTFVYARGYSYLSNNASACANCHIMREHYDAWNKSSHKAVATCNSCHTPHNIVGKYATKARNGFWHSFYFTAGGYPDPLRITGRDREITEQACRHCHEDIVAAIDPDPRARGTSAAHVATASAHAAEPTDCIRCHEYVGHFVR